MTRIRILLAEEDVVVATDLAFELEALGLVLSHITGSVEGVLKGIEAKQVDFAILNVSLQDGVIYPAARRLKEVGIPFAFLTSFDKDEIDPEFQDVPRLSKPDDSKAISEFVAGLVGVLDQTPDPLEGSEKGINR